MAVEREILASMAQHGWWWAYEQAAPDPLPENFDAIQEHVGSAWNQPPAFYVVASRHLRLIGVDSLLGQYYALRVTSLLLTALTFLFIIMAAREFLDDDTAFCAAAFAALVPQLALIGVSVGPDPFVFAAAALVWWQAARLLNGRAALVPLVLMVVATVAAVFAKRLALPLAVQIAGVAFLMLFTGSWRRRLLAIAAFGLLALGAVGLLAAGKLFARPDELAYDPITGAGVALAMARRYLATVGWNGRPSSLSYFSGFSWHLFESAYLNAGSLRYPALPVVTGGALLVFGGAVLAGVIAPFQQPSRSVRLAVAASLIFVSVQLFAIYGTEYYFLGSGAQGRFLFPAIGPFTLLSAVGVIHGRLPWTPRMRAWTVIAVMAVVDLVAWTTTVIPPYFY
jgi:hypothetical protein